MLTCLKALNTSKAPGADGVPTEILKTFAEQLAEPIKDIFQTSINTATVPNDWKQANVVPVYKKG